MKIYFRELTTDDIPNIREISKNIWDGEDYIPQVIEKWLQDKNCMNYGAFMDEDLGEIVGFGRVKFYNDKLAWLEGGRVNIKYQKQGVGREMMKFALDYSRKVKAKKAQFDTSSKNQGSTALAKFFGFKGKKSMNVLNAERKDIKFFKTISLDVKKVMAKEVKELYKHFDIGLGEELSIGWSYMPINYLSDEGNSWYVVDSKAILQKVKFNSTSIQESPEAKDVWFIIYGDPTLAIELIKTCLKEELHDEESKHFEIFCSPEIAILVEELGFYYYEGEPFGVVLFEKNLD
ncbi:hypothetical protein LCGC14_0766500 [marine sediment metagenome]|uniref:N-acetyltransferase domain-containing protein n=1 Tax=marine sediment metagenome TaxID=412755 RepID=A0A0F9PZQ5_9ZZZZ|nr:MAG: Acetyltransferase (GNAT) family protein [Candidatus Lokiarchaeum sp. GC14_75]